jgi:hypothetical protein
LEKKPKGIFGDFLGQQKVTGAHTIKVKFNGGALRSRLTSSNE